jgi:hypothetical protein
MTDPGGIDLSNTRPEEQAVRDESVPSGAPTEYTPTRKWLDSMLQEPDPYTGRLPIPPGVGPGTQPFTSAKDAAGGTPDYEIPLKRNVQVGPLVVSACKCPQCGEIYAHYALGQAPIAHWYQACLSDDEPDPPCWRCEVSVGIPLSPDEAGAMAEFRWRYDNYLKAAEAGSGQSTDARRHAFIVGCDSGMNYAPKMLEALERRYGNQVDAGVQKILNGTPGVV